MHKRLKHISLRYAAAQQKHVRNLKRVSKKPLFTVPIATFMVLLLGVAGWFFATDNSKNSQLNLNESKVVIINYDKQESTIPTRAKTVGELLDRLKIKLHSGDVVEPAEDTEIIGDNFRVNVHRAVPVTIVDGDKKQFTYSAAATPRSIVKQAGITVYPEDKLELLPTENFLEESSIGERVVIDRATPINVNLYGTKVVMRTHATTVGELLKEKKITMGKDDSVQPVVATKLTANSQIFLIRKGTKIVTEEQVIAAPVETIEDSSLTFGTSVVRQQGTPGKKLITYQLVLNNGKEVSRKRIQEVIVAEPVKQVVARGKNFNPSADKAAAMTAAGISRSDFPYVDYIVSRESGWCHTKWQGEYGGCPAYHGTPTSDHTGYGLCQSTPGYKMASAGADWGMNPVTQLRWCDNYAKTKTFKPYGKGWYAAYQYWQVNSHW